MEAIFVLYIVPKLATIIVTADYLYHHYFELKLFPNINKIYVAVMKYTYNLFLRESCSTIKISFKNLQLILRIPFLVKTTHIE